MWSSTFDIMDPVIGDSVLRGRYRLPPSRALLDRTCRTHRTGTSRCHPYSPLPPSGEVLIVVLILLFECPRSNMRLRSPQGTLLPLRHAQLGLFSLTDTLSLAFPSVFAFSRSEKPQYVRLYDIIETDKYISIYHPQVCRAVNSLTIFWPTDTSRRGMRASSSINPPPASGTFVRKRSSTKTSNSKTSSPTNTET